MLNVVRTYALTTVSAFSLFAGAGAFAPSAQALSPSPTVNNATRASALAAYNSVFLPAKAQASGSTGNTANCTPGATSADGQNAGVAMINYYRSMNKLAPVSLNAAWSATAQKTALIMAANNKIDHHPTSAWRCYTPDGTTGAAMSNLAMGFPTTGSSVAGYMDDHGNASTLGHRRWLLDPSTTQVGVGQVGSFNAVKIFDGTPGTAPSTAPKFVSWPAAGYVPKALLPIENTWSFSASDASVDMSAASVVVKSGNTVIPTTVVHLQNGFGKPAVEFKPTTNYTGGADKAFTVTVTGMKRGGVPQPSYSYTTTLFDEGYTSSPAVGTAPSVKANSITWNVPTAVKVKGSVPLNPTTTSGSGTFSFSASMNGANVCSFSGNSLVFGAPGTCTLTITQPAADGYAAASLTKTFTVS